MSPYDSRRAGAGWQTRCEDCGEWTEAASLAPMAGWMSRHICPAKPKEGN